MFYLTCHLEHKAKVTGEVNSTEGVVVCVEEIVMDCNVTSSREEVGALPRGSRFSITVINQTIHFPKS